MIFTKTKIGTHEVAEFLNTKGIKADALNGDLPQDTRERLVDRLKSGHLDVIAATDVAARGLDVNRITHVINYDMPSDIESYVHRIGRTGRAGRQGDSISLITPRQKRFLEDLQDHTGAIVEKMILPTLERINTGREKRLEDKIKHISENEELDQYQEFIQRILVDLDMEPNELAAHLLKLQHGEKDLWLKEGELEDHSARSPRDRERGERRERGDHGDRNRRERGERGERGERKRDGKRDRDNRRDRSPREDKEISDQATPLQNHPDVPMERFQLGVGYQNQVKPGQIVGAIANEAELDSEFIGHIEISETFSTVDLPAGMPKEVMNHLKKTQVNGQKLEIQKFTR
jgi:ATP-dependent RNA helicase DeaD